MTITASQFKAVSWVENVLALSGHAPWTTYPTWGRLYALAVAVEDTITDQAARVRFVADAVSALAEIHPDEAARHLSDDDLEYLIETASDARPTPCGSTELWGSALQALPIEE